MKSYYPLPPPKCASSFIYDTLRASSKNVKNSHGRVLGLEPLIKVRLLHGCFSRFSNCANDVKSRRACRQVLFQKIWVGESNLLLRK